MNLILKDSSDVVSISDKIFNYKFNKSLIHQIIVAYLAGARSGSHAQKNRSEVSGSGKKPWRQKGTGRARSGSIKSPIWRSGGVTFAARPYNYAQKINKKMYRNGIKSILSELLRLNRLIIVKNFFLETYKIKFLIRKLKDMNLKDTLIITNNFDRNLFLASRNLSYVNVCNVNNIQPLSLILFNTVVITIDAVKRIEEVLL